MRTLSIANQKGGCGKTTTAVNLAAALAQTGHKAILIDLDPQGHATLAFGYAPDRLERTIYDSLRDSRISLSDVLQFTNVKGLALAPSNILLSGLETDMAFFQGRESLLSDCLRSLGEAYDVCIIDCSPSLNVLTLNALVASSDVVIPVQTHYYALEGLRQLLETIDVVNERFNPALQIAGVLLTFVEDRTRLSRDVQQQMKDFFGSLVFETVIHRNIRLAEAPSAGQSCMTYDPHSKGAQEYRRLAREIGYEIRTRTAQESIIHI
ncbi:MAG: ParA family protein [Sedimentisphaerales bacterium]|nr:ParA family protein [Sedimentisphaerales bacterium]